MANGEATLQATVEIAPAPQTTAIEERKVGASITSFDAKGLEFLAMPFDLYATDSGFWKDKEKVIKLMLGFRLYRKIERARVYAGISKPQYYYFIEIHPQFSDVLDEIAATRQNDRLNKILDSDDWRAAAYLLEKEPGSEFAKDALPPGGMRATEVNEAVMDAEGKILISRRSVELLKDHGNSTSQ